MIYQVQEWITKRISRVGGELKESVSHPDSFQCGFDMGYKQCLLELDDFIRGDEEHPDS